MNSRYIDIRGGRERIRRWNRRVTVIQEICHSLAMVGFFALGLYLIGIVGGIEVGICTLGRGIRMILDTWWLTAVSAVLAMM